MNEDGSSRQLFLHPAFVLKQMWQLTLLTQLVIALMFQCEMLLSCCDLQGS